MAILTGKVKSMRVVEGQYKDGKRKGETWEFLAIDIIDEDSGLIWSCQLPSEDESYQQHQGVNLTNHRVQVVVMGQSAGEWVGRDGTTKKQVRSSIADVQDLGAVRRSAAVA